MLEVKDITKKTDKLILDNISFGVSQGEYFVLLGKSGAGKTMLLEILAGLVSPDSGSIKLNGRDITKEKIQNRKTGLVYQEQALFPHLTVKENIAYPLRCSKLKEEDISSQVEKLAVDIGCTEFLERKPETLSSGEAQRAALARTIASEPECLLLDEPISSLDLQSRAKIRSLLRSINRSGLTMLHVTHDYEEAVSLGSRIAVLENGSISQIGSPQEVFQHPKSEFVARFIGIRNVFRGELKNTGGELAEFKIDGISFSILSDRKDGRGTLILRSKDITISTAGISTSARNIFKGIIIDMEPDTLGIEVTVDIGTKITSLITHESMDKLGLAIGREAWIHFKASAARYIED